MSAVSKLQAAWLQRGWLAWLLLPISCLYGFVVALRAICYRLGLMQSMKLPVPVIVVGNLVAGGAGKTPTTIALVRLLRERGFNPGVLSRGYGRQARDVVLITRQTPADIAGDEPLLIHLRTDAPVAVSADRIAGGRALLQSAPSVNILISDDGLQHRRLVRDAQVIVFDERGIGNGWLLPAGPLREPALRTLPPRSVVLYNAPAPTTMLRGHQVVRRLSGLASLSDWWAGQPTRADAFMQLSGREVLAAAGLARPQRFFDMLRAHGLSITELPLPDHYDFATLPWASNTTDVVVTEKDAVKLKPEAMGSTRVWVAPLDFDLSPAFANELMQWLPPNDKP